MAAGTRLVLGHAIIPLAPDQCTLIRLIFQMPHSAQLGAAIIVDLELLKHPVVTMSVCKCACNEVNLVIITTFNVSARSSAGSHMGGSTIVFCWLDGCWSMRFR